MFVFHNQDSHEVIVYRISEKALKEGRRIFLRSDLHRAGRITSKIMRPVRSRSDLDSCNYGDFLVQYARSRVPSQIVIKIMPSFMIYGLPGSVKHTDGLHQLTTVDLPQTIADMLGCDPLDPTVHTPDNLSGRCDFRIHATFDGLLRRPARTPDFLALLAVAVADCLEAYVTGEPKLEGWRWIEVYIPCDEHPEGYIRTIRKNRRYEGP
jgi:hypothetical protein